MFYSTSNGKRESTDVSSFKTLHLPLLGFLNEVLQLKRVYPLITHITMFYLKKKANVYIIASVDMFCVFRDTINHNTNDPSILIVPTKMPTEIPWF